MITGNPNPQMLQAILTTLQALGPTLTNPTTFAPTPGQHKVDDVIDYTTKGGKALHEEGGSAPTSPFDLEAHHLVVFIQELAFQAK